METTVMGRWAAHVMSLAVLAGVTAIFGTAAATEPEMSFMTVAGAGDAPLNVMETGNPAGPEILFIHGMGMSYLSFLPQYQSELAGEFRIVAMDLRGHGGSAKPWRTEDVQPSTIWADDIAAVIAAKKLGLLPFCITIDKKANDYLPHLFGRCNYAVIHHPEKLPQALPLLYSQLTQ